jgi:hypothetical protein
MSTPCSRRYVAKLWRSMCGITRVLISGAFMRAVPELLALTQIAVALARFVLVDGRQIPADCLAKRPGRGFAHDRVRMVVLSVC